jgi:hypothetical protein
MRKATGRTLRLGFEQHSVNMNNFSDKPTFPSRLAIFLPERLSGAINDQRSA